MTIQPSHNDWQQRILIRQLVFEDLAALEWDGEYTHFRRLYQEIYQNACNGKALMWLADLPGEEIVGQVFVQLDSSRNELANGKSRAYIYGFRVKPAYQCAGIGTKMLTTVENDLQKRKYEWITLNVGRENLDARRFYDRRGYYVVAADPGQWSYYDNQGKKNQVNEPAWRMLKRLR